MWVHAAGWLLLFVVIAVLLLAITYQPTGKVGGYRPEDPPRKPPAPPTDPGSSSHRGTL
ncbi:hypothetical protein [Citricoccus sp. K5]|uniref:hypothetical protein n=1 Tax=Citricoccus sp. K5 TaxID=2653135 RepID=UPI0012F39044|nr:hypothetical protein [Citricoccus sp. K5]VXA92579.1 hypothetical protein CITRIK5_100028 [Citricoccus sp. K5]VXA95041.1 hypothetical protein CITRIK5_100094 [Citricoccus sp. K5]